MFLIVLSIIFIYLICSNASSYVLNVTDLYLLCLTKNLLYLVILIEPIYFVILVG